MEHLVHLNYVSIFLTTGSWESILLSNRKSQRCKHSWAIFPVLFKIALGTSENACQKFYYIFVVYIYKILFFTDIYTICFPIFDVAITCICFAIQLKRKITFNFDSPLQFDMLNCTDQFRAFAFSYFLFLSQQKHSRT